MRIKITKPTLGEAATGVMRENVKREIVTHHALRITHYVLGFPRQPGCEAFSSVSASFRSCCLLFYE